jgi:tRNA pseudouridine38-40 synthase
MPRYLLTIEYDGMQYHGWQRQEGLRTVQQSLEVAISKAFGGLIVPTVACGRTDAGVHAIAMPVHVDLPEAQLYRIQHAINYYAFQAGEAFAVTSVRLVADDFHARFSAVNRVYRYLIHQQQAPLVLFQQRAWRVVKPLDMEAMRLAAQHLVGMHDFTSFRATECQAKNPVRTIDSIVITQQGVEIACEFMARSFLHHMVRNMVGTLKMVGEGKISSEAIPHMLAARERSAAGETAPAYGLYFLRAEYILT